MGLLAEDLLLLLLDDETGKLAASSYADTALGGAVLSDLAILGTVAVRERERPWHSSTVEAVPGAPRPSDPLLADKLAVVAEKPRPASSLVSRLGKDVRPRLLETLAARGVLERREDRVLGLIPRRRWPAVDSRHEEEVRRALAAVLLRRAEPDARTAALVGLLQAVGQAHRVVPHPGVPDRDVRARAKEVADGDWGSDAVRRVVQSSQAAVITAISAGAVATGGSG